MSVVGDSSGDPRARGRPRRARRRRDRGDPRRRRLLPATGRRPRRPARARRPRPRLPAPSSSRSSSSPATRSTSELAVDRLYALADDVALALGDRRLPRRAPGARASTPSPCRRSSSPPPSPSPKRRSNLMPFTDSRLGAGTLKLGPPRRPPTSSTTKSPPSGSRRPSTPRTARRRSPSPTRRRSRRSRGRLNIDAIQDFEEPAGLVNYLMDNELAEQFFEWIPMTSDGDQVRGQGSDHPDGDRRRRRRPGRHLGRAARRRRADPHRRRLDGRRARAAREEGRVIRLRGTIEYEGGRDRDASRPARPPSPSGSSTRSGTATRSATSAPPMLSALVIAHHALGVEEGFDVWRQLVVGVELETPDGVPPTLPEAYSRLMVELALALERPLARDSSAGRRRARDLRRRARGAARRG